MDLVAHESEKVGDIEQRYRTYGIFVRYCSIKRYMYEGFSGYRRSYYYIIRSYG